jgi:hypothetical protein
LPQAPKHQFGENATKNMPTADGDLLMAYVATFKDTGGDYILGSHCEDAYFVAIPRMLPFGTLDRKIPW